MSRAFQKVEAYRFNSASIRVRVVDGRFRGKSVAERDEMIDPYLDELAEETRADIMVLLALTPDEMKTTNGKTLMNLEFEHPAPSSL